MSEGNNIKDDTKSQQKESKVVDTIDKEKKGKVRIIQDKILIKGERFIKANGKFTLLTETQERNKILDDK